MGDESVSVKKVWVNDFSRIEIIVKIGMHRYTYVINEVVDQEGASSHWAWRLAKGKYFGFAQLNKIKKHARMVHKELDLI